MRLPVEIKCPICRAKYYSPSQDQLHSNCLIILQKQAESERLLTEGGEGRISEHGTVDVASPSHIEIPSSHTQVSESVKVSSEKKIKKVDKRSKAYRKLVGR